MISELSGMSIPLETHGTVHFLPHNTIAHSNVLYPGMSVSSGCVTNHLKTQIVLIFNYGLHV